MGRGGNKIIGPELTPLDILPMKSLYGRAKSLRTSTYLIEGRKAIIDIKGSILKPFRHNRTCYLLKSHNKINPFLFIIDSKILRKSEHKNILQKIKDRFNNSGIAFFCL